jgi:hypothetical protein
MLTLMLLIDRCESLNLFLLFFIFLKDLRFTRIHELAMTQLGISNFNNN